MEMRPGTLHVTKQVNGRMATARRASETFPSGSAQDRDSYHEDDIHSLESEQQGDVLPEEMPKPPCPSGKFLVDCNILLAYILVRSQVTCAVCFRSEG